jgi:alpha-beta hydrolase superfamily lysophospholipase
MRQVSSPDRPGVKPTIVLVHGAFADASSWNGVIERLQQQGYTVIAPANPLRGVTADSAYTARSMRAC